MREVLIRCLKFLLNSDLLAAAAPAAAITPAVSPGSSGGVEAEPAASEQSARPREPLPFPTPFAARKQIVPPEAR